MAWQVGAMCICWRVAYVLAGNKAISAAKIRLFGDTAKFLPTFITFATAKKIQKKAGWSSRMSLSNALIINYTYNLLFTKIVAQR